MPPENDEIVNDAPPVDDGGATPALSGVDPGATPAPPATPDDAARKAAESARQVADGQRAQREERDAYLRALNDLAGAVKPAAPAEEAIEVDEPVSKYVQRALDQAVKPLIKQYEADKSKDAQYKASQEFEAAARRFGVDATGSEITRRDLEDMVRDVPTDQLANPKIWDQAYYIKLGEREHERRQSEARRSPAVSASARSAGYQPGPSMEYNQQERAVAARHFPGMADADIALLSKPIDIDEYRAVKAKKAGAK